MPSGDSDGLSQIAKAGLKYFWAGRGESTYYRGAGFPPDSCPKGWRVKATALIAALRLRFCFAMVQHRTERNFPEDFPERAGHCTQADLIMANETITSVPGFWAGALRCGIKQAHKPDLAMLISKVPAVAAAVFTRNKIVGAPIIVGRRNVRSGRLHGCIINSGCSNVCTGRRGIRDAREMCQLTADALIPRIPSVSAGLILPGSTGVIGHFLPMEKLRAGIPRLAGEISDSESAGVAFAQGILTTDTRVKMAAATLRLGSTTVRIAGVCKGSGMIAPNMATMLAYVATDAAIAVPLLRRTVQAVVDETFNCVTVDQHTSTSDTFACLANGLAGHRVLRTAGPQWKKFRAGLFEVCDALSRQIAADGEGATKLVRVFVTGAASAADARKAAMAIANSPLVKTAIHGGDPNWGRFVSAAGYSGARMREDRCTCQVGSITVFKNGQPTRVDLGGVEQAMKQSELDITVDLGTGRAFTCRVYTCDLSRQYITINADYHT